MKGINVKENAKPSLYGSKVTLRSVIHKDTHDLFEVYGNQQVMKYASDPVFTSIDMMEQMLNSVTKLEDAKESYEWAVVDNQTGKVIGTCGLHSFSDCRQLCEIGCLLNLRFWGQGYMYHVLTLLLEYAKSQDIKTITADIDPCNVRSQALFKRLGFENQQGVFTLTVSKDK
ncbi:hypothetical protein VINI7043_25527 [Vibrio nigripulchritudo ATCC 27043]|uniref:GNAT family N-acetyltransferase n=1 Tax=Vibrio nigripulchritudo TaxID=28173 RepID=UPI00021C2E57|nr:GNAT family N-acetyltransferase [Vibrio nigripulchritudo]EGU53109.1 hypothetical protein VINI7043_25527 [Vibrio nigripulchritudo ATCC 27043]